MGEAGERHGVAGSAAGADRRRACARLVDGAVGGRGGGARIGLRGASCGRASFGRSCAAVDARRFLMRRGSASSTSNSKRPGPGHQLAAHRHAADARRPDSRRACRPPRPRRRRRSRRRSSPPRPRGWRARRRGRSRRAGAPRAARRPRRARPRCRRRSARRCPRSRRGRRCRRIRRPPAPDGCASPASSPAGRSPASTAARTGSRARSWPTTAASRDRWP